MTNEPPSVQNAINATLLGISLINSVRNRDVELIQSILSTSSHEELRNGTINAAVQILAQLSRTVGEDVIEKAFIETREHVLNIPVNDQEKN